jgi:hypothetical protein
MNALPQNSAWSIDEHQFDPNAGIEEKLRFALRYAVLAPSNHNTQPWHFIVDGDRVTLCADRMRALFDAMPRRVTTRETFADEPVPVELQLRLEEAGAAEGADIVCVGNAAIRERLATLITEADHAQFKNPRFRRELASWIHPKRSQDGMPALSPGMRALLDLAVPLVGSVIRTFDLGGGMAAAHHTLVTGSPLLLCIATGADDAAAWLAAGQALERVLLITADEGITASYLNQPIEVASLRDTLRAALNLDGVPQLLLRIGRGRQMPHSPRRPLADIVS